jgi:hypothetical protein
MKLDDATYLGLVITAFFIFRMNGCLIQLKTLRLQEDYDDESEDNEG